MPPSSEVREFFDRVALERHKWRRRNRIYYEDLESFIESLVPPNSSVLVVGCGSGDLLNRLRPARGLGIDLSELMIAMAKQKYPRLSFLATAAEDLSLAEKFDYIVLFNFVGYAVDVQRVLENIFTGCTVNTRVILTYYNYLWEPLLKLAEKISLRMPQPEQNWLSLVDLENLLHLSSFEVVRKGGRFICPISIPVITRLLNRIFCRLPFVQRLCLTNFLIARPTTVSNGAKPLSCSVVVPARNERGNIQAVVERMPNMGSFTEVIFVEGHSTDGTLQEIERVARSYRGSLRLKYLVQQGTGKGDAVRHGFAEAKGDILMILDADLTVPPEDLPKFFNALDSNRGEFINGCRLVYQMDKQAMRSLNLLANKVFSLIFTWLLDQRLKDTLCGTKALSKENYRKVEVNRTFFGDFDPFGDFDLLFGAAKLNLKILEIPIRYRERTYGSTNIRRFKHGWLLLRMCLVAARRLKFS
jgi:SAM-dependent methyltransferase